MSEIFRTYKVYFIFLSGFLSAVIILLLAAFVFSNFLSEKNYNISNYASSSLNITSSPTVAVTENPTHITSVESENKIDITHLPLGDNKITTTTPKKGYVYRCGLGNGNGGGAQKDGNWISGNFYDLTKKIHIQGDVKWSNASFSNKIIGDKREIISNDLPLNHNTGIYPVSKNDPAYNYDKNPNSIKSQDLNYSLNSNPSVAVSDSCIGGGPVGIMLSGVILFDGLDAENRDAVAHEIQDKCDGHPQENGQYHYHSMSNCISDEQTNKLVGYAMDGFGIYGNKDTNDNEITSDQLDECHGTTSLIDWEGKKVNMYHYVLTRDFPYTISCFKGTPLKISPIGDNGNLQQGRNQMPPPRQ